MALDAIELALYIHFPWCVQKCPYCDFNSHKAKGQLPQQAYLDALIAQFRQVKARAQGRAIETIFIGGGTPSLIDAAHIERLLTIIKSESEVAPDLEVTLEANPGASDEGRFVGYLHAGVNRLSIGVQSFNDDCLRSLGRVHDSDAAKRAIKLARTAGFENVNVDLMYGLPAQTVAMAMNDLNQAIDSGVEHISLYQLTIEPNTLFAVSPPALPDEETCWQMQQSLLPLLVQNGYARYEVSAFCKDDHYCRHNLNYWTFGDYLAIGAGGHAKLTQRGEAGLEIHRYWNKRQPKAYIQGLSDLNFLGGEHTVPSDQVAFEFMLNALRLRAGFDVARFEQTTGQSGQALTAAIAPFVQCGWLKSGPDRIVPTALGYRFIDEILESMLPQRM